MERHDTETRPDLWAELCDCEQIIHNLEKEISGMEAFIAMVAGNQADINGLESSLNFEFYMSELEKFKKRRDSLTVEIEALEINKLGEEIPRSPSGTIQVPFDVMKSLSDSVNEGLDEVLRELE